MRMVLIVAAVVAVVAAGFAQASDPVMPDGLRLNQIQVIGTHNSYKRAVQRELFEHLVTINPGVRGIDYSHISMTDQLNLGVRTLELDVYFDPEGGRYADPLGNRLLTLAGGTPEPLDDAQGLASPGFKVIHDADFDFRTWHATLEGALDELAAWSAANPGHLPILLTMNTKQGRGEWPGAVEPGRFTAAVFKELDATIREHLGASRLITPDDVRGDAATLEAAVLGRGWPTLASSRGKFLFVLDEGGRTRETYLSAFGNLEGAVFFTTSAPGEPTAGVLVINDPLRDGARIRALVERGYIVRTRADAGTNEARSEDFARFEAAKASGAHAIKTDYPIPDRRMSDRYVVRFDGGWFARVNPVTGE